MSLLHAQKEQQQTQEHKHRQRQEEEEDCEEEPLEALIVGAGPAGLIAASYLKEFCSFGPPRSSSSSSADDDGKGGGGGGGQRKGRMVILDETFSPGGIWNREGDHRENVPCFCVDNEDDENDVDDPTRIRTSLNSRSNGDSASSNGRRRKSSSSFAVETSTQPLYENLSTNFPKDLMSFCGEPYEPNVPLFPYAEEVTKYYQNYVDRTGFQKDGSIRYGSRVVECHKGKQSDNNESNGNENNKRGDDCWTVQTSKGDLYKTKRLLVCTGHYRKAFVPPVRGIRHFFLRSHDNNNANNNRESGSQSTRQLQPQNPPALLRKKQRRLLHSSAFRSANDFVGRKVLVVGGGISGSDLCHHLARDGCCERLVVSVRNLRKKERMLLSFAQKHGTDAGGTVDLEIRPGIDRVDDEGNVRFLPPPQENNKDKDDKDKEDDVKEEGELFDDIIFATGYRYWYPFFEKELSSRIMMSREEVQASLVVGQEETSNDDDHVEDPRRHQEGKKGKEEYYEKENKKTNTNNNDDGVHKNTEENNTKDEGYKLRNLFLRMVYVDDPSLVFLGVTNVNLPSSISLEYQARLYARVVQNELQQRQQYPTPTPASYFGCFTEDEMRTEISSHEKNDFSQEALGPAKFPGYIKILASATMKQQQQRRRQRQNDRNNNEIVDCNNDRHKTNIDGYYGYLLKNRMPLILHSLWIHRRTYPRVVGWMTFAVFAAFVVQGALVAIVASVFL